MTPAPPCDGRLPGSAPLPEASRMACRALGSAVAGSVRWLGALAPLRAGSRMADVRALSGRVRVGDRIPGAPLSSLCGLGVGLGCPAPKSAVQGFTGVPGRLWGRDAIPCAPLVSPRSPVAGSEWWFGRLVTSGEERAV